MLDVDSTWGLENDHLGIRLYAHDSTVGRRDHGCNHYYQGQPFNFSRLPLFYSRITQLLSKIKISSWQSAVTVSSSYLYSCIHNSDENVCLGLAGANWYQWWMISSLNMFTYVISIMFSVSVLVGDHSVTLWRLETRDCGGWCHLWTNTEQDGLCAHMTAVIYRRNGEEI